MNGKDSRTMRKLMASIALTATLIAISGCGSTVDGYAMPGEIDVRLLEVGKYPTRPLSEYSVFSHSFKSGRTLASMRLADSLVLGQEVDPKLTFGSFQSIDSDTPTVMSKAVLPALKPNRMLYGFATGNSDMKEFSAMSLSPGDESLADIMRQRKPTYFGLTVMQFSDAAAAERAAAEIERLDFDVAADLNVRVSLDKYPSAHSHWRPGIASMVSTLSHGSYVLNVQAGVPEPEAKGLTNLIQKVIDAQLQRLEKLTPLSPVEVVQMTSDPDQVLERTLNPQKLGIPDTTNFGSYGLQGFLQTRRDLSIMQDSYKKAGADRFGRSWDSYLIRTRDSDAAQTLLDEMFIGDTYKPTHAPDKLPSAKCAENNDAQGDIKRFSCVVQYRRYVAHVQSHQLPDVHQRAAAQYAILANSQ
ncbi:hypothetical protein ACFWPX_19930 [Nocardia sp. NPDC058518]|uniref:DUF7373 family lipoprotein n=1 Tax=Nocardia sp. NPDC058518 TaxID=3346534 RepID=UPI00365F3B86